jgi:DNA-binding transcriptional LysR family regulator
VGVVLEMALTPILTTLAQLHPRLTVEVHADQSLVDIVAEGYDAGIRLRRAIQQDMVTTRLTGSFKAVLVASRDYSVLEAHRSRSPICISTTVLDYALANPVQSTSGN